MIRFFENMDVANAWLMCHPLERPVSVAPGHLSGSILLLTWTDKPLGRPKGSLNKEHKWEKLRSV